jgi:hypothetical protein
MEQAMIGEKYNLQLANNFFPFPLFSKVRLHLPQLASYAMQISSPLQPYHAPLFLSFFPHLAVPQAHI